MKQAQKDSGLRGSLTGNITIIDALYDGLGAAMHNFEQALKSENVRKSLSYKDVENAIYKRILLQAPREEIDEIVATFNKSNKNIRKLINDALAKTIHEASLIFAKKLCLNTSSLIAEIESRIPPARM